MLDRLLCWLKGAPREEPTPPKTRLTPEEAIALGQAAIGPTSDLSRMAVATFEQRGARGVWHVTSYFAMGSLPFADIDDATGQILDKGWRGVR